MHGCSLADAPLVNAEVDSMGGVVDSGVGASLTSSPQREAIEIAQAELRREYDVREERRRELEFLEKGGNPLDFKFGSATSLSIQSTSLTGQPPGQPVTSEAHGDSVESSGRPEATVASEPNCADNLLLFDGENSVDGGKNSLRFVRSKNTPSEQNTPLENNVHKSSESADLSLPKSQAYKRRVRSRPNRDSARSSSTDINPAQNVKGSIMDMDNHITKPVISNGIISPTNVPSNGVVDMVLDEGPDGLSKLVLTKVGQPKLVPDCDKKMVTSEFAEPPSVSPQLEAEPSFIQDNGCLDIKGDEEKVPNESANCSDTLKANGLDSESNCSGTCLNLDKESESVPLDGLKSDDLISSFSPRKESVEIVNKKDGDKVEGIGSQEEEKQILSVDEMKVDGIAAVEIEKKTGNISNDDLDPAKENVYSHIVGSPVDNLTHQNPISEKENFINGHQDPPTDSSDTNKHKASIEAQLKLDVRAQEDSILKEARIIEAKRKRIAQLSVGAFISENHQKSHWDFVLEEMAWLANDFAQERLWKISAAAQLSHRVASASRERLVEKNSLWRQKKVALTLSKAVMEFWLSAEELSKEMAQLPLSNSVPGVKEYAVRYLKYSKPFFPFCLSEEPATPERIYDLGNKELSWEEKYTEENLFYTVPPGAMETYRRAIESHFAQVERAGSSTQEVVTSLYDATADCGSHGNAFEEAEGETNTCLPSGDDENGKPSKFGQKKRIVIKSTSDLPLMQNKFGTQQSGPTVKRSPNNIHISSIPTKRMRTASRPRFTAPFAGTSGGTQVPNKADGSSGDNNSFQDDQSTFLGGSPNNTEVESVGDFERQLPFDPNEVSKPKKKKKQKHLGPMYEQSQRWPHGNNLQNEPGAFSRKRFEKLAESNGSTGLFGQPVSKKPKLRHPVDISLDSYSPMTGSVPSPVASQMSNMANSNKLVKFFNAGNRGKKQKPSKIPVGQTGPGNPWSSFEEQALIVLVHDLGPNWELISDAINNILQYKCIFRKPKECSEHHKELISRTVGDGADSADDSGSSQPYPPTLPGIPKGSARALFQRLQEPIEEDMIKVHFEKIIIMSQKQHYLKMQNDNKDQKPIQPHSSHALALSQVFPNNISGGPVLTPLDLCDTTGPSPDIISSGYQGTHSGGLTISNTSGGASLHSGANSSLQGSPNMVHGNNYSSPSAPVNPSMRDGRYGVPRSASMSIDEHQRVNHYNNPMMPGRVAGTPQGTDRGVRMMAGGNGMGIMCRNMTNMARPGFPVINPSSVLNSGNMLNSNMAEPGNSMLRPRDSLNMIRPAQVPQHQRQMMVAPDHQIQATQGNVQAGPPFVGISGPPFPQQSHIHNSNPHLQGPNHSPQHQAHAIRLAKERQLQLQQQRILQQQQFAASSGVIPRGPPAQPAQSSLQHMSHIQPPTTSASVSVPLTTSSSSNPAMSQHQQKPHNLTRNLQSGGNQIAKQRQRQPQQKQRPPPQQRAKITKGHQNSIETPSVLNGQITEKPEKTVQGQGLNKHLVQQQRSYSGQVIGSSKQGQNSNQGHASPPTSGNPLPTSHQGDSPAVTSSSNSHQLQPTQKLTNQSLQPVQRVVQQNRQIINSESSSNKSPAHHGQSDSSPSQLSTTEQASVKPTVGPHFRAAEKTQNILLPKSTETQSDPTGNPSTSLSRTKSQGSGEVQESSQMSLLPLSQEQQALQSEHIQPENCNLQATVRSTDNRLE